MNKLVLFGAGKIGRSFIGQLFSASGYEVVFIDINPVVIDQLNQRRGYQVVIKNNQSDRIIEVSNVRGVLATDSLAVTAEVASADVVALSVGQAGLKTVLPLLAKSLVTRLGTFGKKPLDIIIAENMRNADEFIRTELSTQLGSSFPFDEMVGLVETSIGKMVPLMPLEIQESDPLLVYAEPYNTLILDQKGFKNPIPEVVGLSPKENIKAWVDCKSYIHNFGHAAAVYIGFLAHPEATYLYEVLADKQVHQFTRNAMLQSAVVLMHKYPGEFAFEELINHIDDLLERFENKALGDTIYRIGCDLPRKLHRNDRVLSPTIDGAGFCVPIDLLIFTYACGLNFRAKSESGELFATDKTFARVLEKEGPAYTLTNICGLNPDQYGDVFRSIILLNESVKDNFNESFTAISQLRQGV